MTGAAITMLRHTGKVAAGALSATLIARLGWPALGAVAVLAVLATGLVFWVLSSDARVARVTQILTAWRGGIASPEPDAPAISRPGSHRRTRRQEKR